MHVNLLRKLLDSILQNKVSVFISIFKISQGQLGFRLGLGLRLG
jgi:hypothetical protein